MKRFGMEVQPNPDYYGVDERYNDIYAYEVNPYEITNGDWVKWDDAAKLVSHLEAIASEWSRQKSLFPELEKDGWMDLAVAQAKVTLQQMKEKRND